MPGFVIPVLAAVETIGSETGSHEVGASRFPKIMRRFTRSTTINFPYRRGEIVVVDQFHLQKAQET